MTGSISTSLFHIVGVMPELALGAHDGEGTARCFAQEAGLVYAGRDPERTGFHRFADGPTSRAATALARINLPLETIGYFLVRASAQSLKAGTLPPEIRPLAEAVTRQGLSPKHKREGGRKLPGEETARLAVALVRARANARVDAEAWVHDGPGRNMITMRGGITDLSKASRLVYTAYHDDRTPKRDGVELANRYSYSGTPGHSEVSLRFADEFGMLMRYAPRGGYQLSYPRVVWEEPGNVQFMDLERSRRHEADLKNYGWRLEVPGQVLASGKDATFGPYRSLRDALVQGDRAMTALRAGQTIEIVPPSAVDLAFAKAFMAARESRNGYREKLEAFLAENGFEDRRAARTRPGEPATRRRAEHAR